MLFDKIHLFITLILSLALHQISVGAIAIHKPKEKLNKRFEILASACQANNERAQTIKDAFAFAYDGYRRYAFGNDELLPISNSYTNTVNHWGVSIVDSLDTMLMMGFEDYYQEALTFVENIDFSTSNKPSKGFETNIRYLGGLLAAHELRPDPVLLKKAVEVAEFTLVPLFVTTTSQGKSLKVPYTLMDLSSNAPIKEEEINLAEFGTYSMEFTQLSKATGNPKYERLTDDLTHAVIRQPTRLPGLYPLLWSVAPFAPNNDSRIGVGGGADSFYEYLIKNYILQNKKDQDLLKAWEKSVESIEKYMLSPTKKNPDIQFVATIQGDQVFYSSQELICFWPGSILLGISQMKDKEKRDKFRSFSDVFFDSCIESWKQTNTGIAPEIWSWDPLNNDLEQKLRSMPSMKNSRRKSKRAEPKVFWSKNSMYDLRPETIESIFYYYRLTGDPKYQDMAWELFLSIEKYAKAKSGYTIVDDVDEGSKQLDFQESFFFAETLKYLYLMFVDKECISLNDYVFNTEAHPFRLTEPIQFQ